MRLTSSFFSALLASILLIGAATSAVAQAPLGELARAVKLDDERNVRRLLDQGYDVNSVDAMGDSLLGVAARDGAPSVVKLLLGRRAKVNMRNRAGDSPIMSAALKGHLEIVKMLHAAGAEIDGPGWTALHYAAYGGHNAVCQFLLDNRADIDARSPNGMTPLMMAVREGRLDTVKLLVWEIADPNLRNEAGLSALDLAIRGKQVDIAKLLRVAGAKE